METCTRAVSSRGDVKKCSFHTLPSGSLCYYPKLCCRDSSAEISVMPFLAPIQLHSDHLFSFRLRQPDVIQTVEVCQCRGLLEGRGLIRVIVHVSLRNARVLMVILSLDQHLSVISYRWYICSILSGVVS